jgi:opacity protein-like surface antigen
VRQRTDETARCAYRSTEVQVKPFWRLVFPKKSPGYRHVNPLTKGFIMKKNHSTVASLIFAAAALTLSAGSQAQSGSNNNNAPVYGASSGYFELGVGQSDFSLGNGIGVFGSDQGDTSYSLRGGRFYGENWGIEFGYTDFGSVSRAGGRTKAEGINVSLIGKLPINPAFNLLGKIGSTYSRTDVSSIPASGIVAGSENGFGLSYGIGLAYALTPQWSATLVYESQDMKFAGNRTERIGSTTLAARYQF